MGFYHICVWWPSWSCDPDAANELEVPLTSNLALTGQAVLEKMFEHCERRTDGRRTMGIL